MSELGKILREHHTAWAYTLETIRVQRMEKRRKDKSKALRENWFPGLPALYVHIPKTAGTSTHAILAAAEAQKAGTHIERSAHRPVKHATARDWRDYLSTEEWNQTFKFSFVRNPWDLMASAYHQWCRKGSLSRPTRRAAIQIRRRSFDRFIDSDYGRYYITSIHGVSFSDWLASNGADLIDFIGRFETFETDMRYILMQLGVNPDSIPLKHRNAADRKPYRDYCTRLSREVVAKRFSDVIERFDYEF